LYAKPPTKDEAAAFGLTVEEAGGPDVEVWPDNKKAVNTFIAMATQWRIGMNGATGLDYAALPFVMRRTGVTTAEHDDVFESLRIMEDAALETIRATQ
jgi:uncharacterized membrane protein